MDYSEMFPNKFLKSQQLKKGDATLTIKGVRLEKFPPKKKGQPDETKGLVSFNETHLEWMLNKTNASCVAAMFGRETNNWIGKRVTLWPAPFSNPFTGEQTTALRVRGSPDLPADKSCTLQIGRDVVQVTMRKTVPRKKGEAAAAAPAPTPPPPEPDQDQEASDLGPADPNVFEPPTAAELAAAEAAQADNQLTD